MNKIRKRILLVILAMGVVVYSSNMIKAAVDYWPGTEGLTPSTNIQVFGIGGLRPDQTTGTATFHALVGMGVTSDIRFDATALKDVEVKVYDSIGSRVIADYAGETPIAESITGDTYEFSATGNPEYQKYRNLSMEIEGFVGRDRDLFFVFSKVGHEPLGVEGFIYPVNNYTVTFEANGGTLVDPITGLLIESKINEPTAPTKEQYTFAGWYKDEGLTNAWDFMNDTIQGDMILYAKWTEGSKPVPPAPEKPSFPKDGNKPSLKAPVTGDPTNMKVAMTLLAMAGLTIIITVKLKKTKTTL